jgi:fructosamine-3-kinase
MKSSVQQAIVTCLGGSRQIVTTRSLHGGCINQAWQVQFDDGMSVFVKQPSGSVPAEHFQVEADGLAALAKPDCIRIPKVLGLTQTDEGIPLLILQYITTGKQDSDFQTLLGRQLATLHQSTTQTLCGWHMDNDIGSTPQSNAWSNDWPTFFRTQRLGYQFDLAQRSGLVDTSFMAMANRLLEQIDTLIDVDEPACLLHGDLWGGNVMCDNAGQPVLIDPAVYFGHREADLAMTRLFGGFTSDFYQAYHDTWPLPPHTLRRQQLYMLYHLLNHLNLFGHIYHEQCLSVMRDLL